MGHARRECEAKQVNRGSCHFSHPRSSNAKRYGFILSHVGLGGNLELLNRTLAASVNVTEESWTINSQIASVLHAELRL